MASLHDELFLNLDGGIQQNWVVTQLFQGSDTSQVGVSLCGGLKARSEDSVAEEMLVQLQLQRGGRAEQRPVETGRQVAVDYLLRAPQDKHASQTRELCRSLLS